MTRVGSQVGHYRITGSLGRGGMGEVFVAYDETLERKVALKSIRTGFRLRASAKARFLREARLLSRLDHPSICRIHDYVDGDDCDYLVLELIEGRTLSQALTEGLSAVERQTVGEQIAEVLVAAHAEGVVHRDLKPDNVMLTPDGAIKVLDFGLARSVDDESLAEAGGDDETSASPAPVDADQTATQALDATRVGTAIGTPRYMSPEQARGEPVTSASDIYSFGLLLQRMHTGAEPYPDSLDTPTLLERAARAETEPVREIDSELTALIERMKSPAPSRRPTAVAALERMAWIRGKPKRRWRNLGAAAVVLLVAAAGVKYTVDLSRERTAAVAAREEADRRRDQAEELIQYMLGDLRGKLEPLGRVELLQDVGDHALDYFASIPEGQLSDEELFRRAQALSQIGEVRIAEGRLDAAREAFNESLELGTGLVTRDSTRGPWIAGLGAAHFWLGNVAWIEGDLDAAERAFGRYLELSRDLTRLDPGDEAWQLEVAYALSSLGAVQESKGEIDAALETIGESVEIKRRLVESKPEEVERRASLANGLSWMGVTLLDAGRLTEAEANFEEELSIREAQVREAPADFEVQTLLANTLFQTGEIHLLLGRSAEGIAYLNRDLTIARKLAKHDPSNLEWQRDLALSLHASGEALVDDDQLDTGLAYLDEAASILDRLLVESSNHAGWSGDLGSIRCSIGRGMLRRGDARAALTRTRRGLGLLEETLDTDLAGDDRLTGLANCLLIEGEAQLALGDTKEARKTWLQAHELLRHHAVQRSGPKLRDIWARTLTRLGRSDEAGPWIERLAESGYRPPAFVELCLVGSPGNDDTERDL